MPPMCVTFEQDIPDHCRKHKYHERGCIDCMRNKVSQWLVVLCLKHKIAVIHGSKTYGGCNTGCTLNEICNRHEAIIRKCADGG